MTSCIRCFSLCFRTLSFSSSCKTNNTHPSTQNSNSTKNIRTSVGNANYHDHHQANSSCKMDLNYRDATMCNLELMKHSIQIPLKKAGYMVNFLFFLAGSSSLCSLNWNSFITLKSHGLSLPVSLARVNDWKDFYCVMISEATSPPHSLSLIPFSPISWDIFIPQIVSQTEFFNFSSESLFCCVLCSN